MRKQLPPGIKAVRFVREWGVYRAGEVAGFAADKCAVMVRDGVAQWHNDSPVPAIAAAPEALELRTENVITKPVEVVVTAEGNVDVMPKRRKWGRNRGQ